MPGDVHVYLFDFNGSKDAVDIARELMLIESDSVVVVPINAPDVLPLVRSDPRVSLVPCVVTCDAATGEWRDVYTGDFLFTHFLAPLRRAVKAKRSEVAPSPYADEAQSPQRPTSAAPGSGGAPSAQEMAECMMQEREASG